MNEVKVFGILMDYNEATDVTAVKIDMAHRGQRAFVKGAAFCSPQDEPRIRVGAYEAIVDALRGAPVEVFLEVIRHAVTAGLFREVGWWESEAIDEQVAREKAYLAGLRDAAQPELVYVVSDSPLARLSCGGCS